MQYSTEATYWVLSSLGMGVAIVGQMAIVFKVDNMTSIKLSQGFIAEHDKYSTWRYTLPTYMIIILLKQSLYLTLLISTWLVFFPWRLMMSAQRASLWWRGRSVPTLEASLLSRTLATSDILTLGGVPGRDTALILTAVLQTSSAFRMSPLVEDTLRAHSVMAALSTAVGVLTS